MGPKCREIDESLRIQFKDQAGGLERPGELARGELKHGVSVRPCHGHEMKRDGTEYPRLGASEPDLRVPRSGLWI